MNRSFFLVPLLLIISTVCAAEAQVNRGAGVRCKHKIIFLPQLHEKALAQGVEDITERKIAESQFRTARYLEAHPNTQIFSEQILENVYFDRLSDETKEVARQTKLLFPYGIPERFADLTYEQRRQLVDIGAEGVLLLTGRVTMLRKVVPNVATQNVIINQIQKGMKEKDSSSVVTQEIVTTDSVPYRLVTTVREEYALKEIIKYFDAYPSDESAILIFGESHDFRRHDKLFPGRCIETPDGFVASKVLVR